MDLIFLKAFGGYLALMFMAGFLSGLVLRAFRQFFEKAAS